MDGAGGSEDWEETDPIAAPPALPLPQRPGAAVGAGLPQVRILRRTPGVGTARPPSPPEAVAAASAARPSLEERQVAYERERQRLQAELGSQILDGAAAAAADEALPHLDGPNPRTRWGPPPSATDPEYRRNIPHSVAARPPTVLGGAAEYWGGHVTHDAYGNSAVTFASVYPPLFPPSAASAPLQPAPFAQPVSLPSAGRARPPPYQYPPTSVEYSAGEPRPQNRP